VDDEGICGGGLVVFHFDFSFFFSLLVLLALSYLAFPSHNHWLTSYDCMSFMYDNDV